jgi:DNA-binding NarL/FixJ family response regulator
VVDDNVAVRDAICHFIDRATPFKARCEAGDGIAAIEKTRERAPTLVILDLSMPRMNGVEAASILRGMLPRHEDRRFHDVRRSVSYIPSRNHGLQYDSYPSMRASRSWRR